MFGFLVSFVFLLSVHGQTCTSDMNNLEGYARRMSQGFRPDGRCYSHVADFLDATGFGGINRNGFNAAIPSSYWQYAYQFAEFLNQGNNAANLCLENRQARYQNNPYNAPPGAIVVVRAGTPGTAHPVAGDIAVASGSNVFWNGGEMGYGGSQNFPASNTFVLGIYEPTHCVGQCNGGGGGGGCDTTGCVNCVVNGGGMGCASPACSGCPDTCLTCINNGGGTGCAERCGGSNPNPSNATQRCGSSFTDANNNCRTACPRGIDSECPSSQFCYAQLSTRPCM